MRKGPAGTAALNAALQAALNGPADGKPELLLGARAGPAGGGASARGGGQQQQGSATGGGTTALRVGDRVVQSRNDYESDVYNGDIGCVIPQLFHVPQTLLRQFP